MQPLIVEFLTDELLFFLLIQLVGLEIKIKMSFLYAVFALQFFPLTMRFPESKSTLCCGYIAKTLSCFIGASPRDEIIFLHYYLYFH